MTLPRFFSRIADAITPVANLDRDALAARLSTVTVHIHAAPDAQRRAASLLAVNIAARLYPNLTLHGDDAWLGQATVLAFGINPVINITHSPQIANTDSTDQEPPTELNGIHLRWNHRGGPDTVGIAADGWNIHIDPPTARATASAHEFAAAAVVAIGMGEVFRTVFADALEERGRRGPQPGSMNLITCGDSDDTLPTTDLLDELPPATLIGAGAVGQACLWTLIRAGVKATLTIVDPEEVTLSNLQRYLLTDDHSVNQKKTALAAAAATDTTITIIEVPTQWAADSRTGPGTDIVLTALDSAADRIAVAASLPGAAYNAWTQPADIGWSRHENFGTQPCLACLYYPDRARPNQHELIAAALRQHPLRVLTYLVTGVPVGAALPLIATVPDLPPPAEASTWLAKSLLHDLTEQGFISARDSGRWSALPIGQLYRDGICAGGLLCLPGAAQPEAALVPLAHQSALAGIMLAAEYYIANQPSLRTVRRATVEARFDVLHGYPQVASRPRLRTAGCLCSDPVYRAWTGNPSAKDHVVSR